MKQLTKKTWYTLLLCTITAMSSQLMYSSGYAAQEAAEARQAAEEKSIETVKNERLERQAEARRQREAQEARMSTQRQNRMSQQQRAFNETQATLDQEQRQDNAARQRNATQTQSTPQKRISMKTIDQIKAEKDIIEEHEDEAKAEAAKAKEEEDLARVEKEKARLAEQEANLSGKETDKTEEPTSQAPQSDNQAPKATPKEYKSGSFGEWINRIIDWIFNSHAKHANTSIQQMWDNSNNGAKQDVEWIAEKIKNDPKEKSEVISAMKTKAQEMYESVKNDPQKLASFKSFFNDDVLSKFDVKMTVENGKVSFELPNDVKNHLKSETAKTFNFNPNETIEQNITRLSKQNNRSVSDTVAIIKENLAEQSSLLSIKKLSEEQKVTLSCKILGIDPEGKTPEQLKTLAKLSYKLKSIKWHPDKNMSDKTGIAEAEFKLINEAYQFIKDLKNNQTK